jgi:hypothetical protein
MTSTELLSILVIVCGFAIAGIHSYLAVRGHSSRWLDILTAFSAFWLAAVFLQNHGAAVPPAAGRPPLVALLAAEIARAIYLLRTRRLQ